jgi:hypothetical protein
MQTILEHKIPFLKITGLKKLPGREYNDTFALATLPIDGFT